MRALITPGHFGISQVICKSHSCVSWLMTGAKLVEMYENLILTILTSSRPSYLIELCAGTSRTAQPLLEMRRLNFPTNNKNSQIAKGQIRPRNNNTSYTFLLPQQNNTISNQNQDKIDKTKTMRDLEEHIAATKHRVSRRASVDNVASSSRSLPPSLLNQKQGRRSSLGINNKPQLAPASPQKKTLRRASLGQMLGNAQKFFTKDDAATVDSDSSCNVSSIMLELDQHHHPDSSNSISTPASLLNDDDTANDPEALLEQVKELILHHTIRKTEMEVTMESDLELAKARLQSGNQLGAILSMRRVHKNTTILAYAAAARYQLAQIRDSLIEQTTAADGCRMIIDCSEHRRAVREITEKLLRADAPTPTDAFLLNQLESQMQEVGV